MAIGLTENGIYIAPLALGFAIFAGWAGRGLGAPVWLAATSAPSPAVAAGLWRLLFDTPATVPEDAALSFVAQGLWNMFPDKILLGLMALTLCAEPLPLADLRRFRHRWAQFPSVVGYTGAFPLCRFPSLGGTRDPAPAGLLGMPETEAKLSFTQRPAEALGVVARVVTLSEGQKVLAAESVSAWLPTVEDYPPLVYVRQIYLDQNMRVVDGDELGPRRILAEWINGGDDLDPEEASAALVHQCPRLLVFPQGQKPLAFDTLATHHSAILVEAVRNHKIYSIDSYCRKTFSPCGGT